MPNTVLVSGPAVGAAQILIWSYSCVFLPPMSTAIRTRVFLLWEFSMAFYIFYRHGLLSWSCGFNLQLVQLYLLLPSSPTPLSTWCCQNPCNPSSCTTSTSGPHRGKPQWMIHMAEVKIKPQLKPRGSVAKEEDPKSFHQQYKLQIKSTWSIWQTLSMEYINEHWELPQKKTH